MRTTLERVAHVRSGDKGNTSNIGVFVYADALYDAVKAQLTAAAFRSSHEGVLTREVIHYEVDGLCALNFVAHGALGGGVSRSLCLVNYGKALSSAPLAFPLVPTRYVVLTDEQVPTLPSGKPDKRTMRERLLAGEGSTGS